jgi:hypothetical protein
MLDLYEELRGIVGDLEKEKIPYVLCGGLATVVYSTPRFTDENGTFRRNSFDSTFNLCSFDQTCSADPQR